MLDNGERAEERSRSVGEFRDPYREGGVGAARRPSSRAPNWLVITWIVAVPAQVALGIFLSFNAWIELNSGQFRQITPWPATHAAWIPIAGFVVGFVGGAVAMRPWPVGALVYALPAALSTLFMAMASEWRSAAIGGSAIATSLLGAAIGFWLIGRRLPRIHIGGNICPRCAYSLTGLPAGAPCPECGAVLPTGRSKQP